MMSTQGAERCEGDLAPNNFRHQRYSDGIPIGQYRVLKGAFPATETEAEKGHSRRLLSLLSQYAKQRLDAVILVHGTFVGNDALGWGRQLNKLWPSAGPGLRMIGKHVADRIFCDAGNFDQAFVDALTSWDWPQQIPVRRFHWSGENTHMGRAIAALELAADLLERSHERRLLIIGHSHGGNVLALLSNLLNADESIRNRFLKTVTMNPRHEKPSGLNHLRVQLVEAFSERRFDGMQLNVVTMGTPIRYGWDDNALASLQHVVHHRPVSDLPDYRCPKPSIHAANSKFGDFVQQFAIAGTDFLPYVFDLKLMWAERQLHRQIEGIPLRDFRNNLHKGMRVHDTGITHLVEYENVNDLANKHLGHSIYTRIEWLPFHAHLITEHLQTNRGS